MGLAIMAQTKLFLGRRMSLLMFMLVLLTIWNVIWMSFSSIVDIENKNEGDKKVEKRTYFYDDLNTFDLVMFLGQDALSQAIYYTVIIAGPIEICKAQMLKENTRIYALLLCTIGCLKYGFEGVFFDDLVDSIIALDFFFERVIVIVLNLVSICSIITLFRDEVGELIR